MRRYLRSFMGREALAQIVKMGIIGVGNTVVFFIFFNVFRTFEVSLFWSVAIAFALATFVSYVLNRKWTFDLEGGRVVMRETISFYAVNLVAWGATEATVHLAQAWFGPLSRIGENVALLAATGIILLPKFAGYRDVVFGKAIEEKKAAAGESPLESSDAGV